MRLSKNFMLSEFTCKCGCKPPSSVISRLRFLVQFGLQPLRDLAGEPLSVNSGYRCFAHNKSVGGAKNSRHPIGDAADIRGTTLSPQELAALAENIPVFKHGGMGIYPTFVHLDTRGFRARWKDV